MVLEPDDVCSVVHTLGSFTRMHHAKPYGCAWLRFCWAGFDSNSAMLSCLHCAVLLQARLVVVLLYCQSHYSSCTARRLQCHSQGQEQHSKPCPHTSHRACCSRQLNSEKLHSSKASKHLNSSHRRPSSKPSCSRCVYAFKGCQHSSGGCWSAAGRAHD